jgi:hypothetical protein
MQVLEIYIDLMALFFFGTVIQRDQRDQGHLTPKTPLLDIYVTPAPSTAPIFMNKNRNHIIDTISRKTRTTSSDGCGVLLSEMRFATLGLFATLVQ